MKIKDKIKTEVLKKTISQEEDCCGRTNEEYQYLDLETYDGGAGFYIVLKTDRWAIDDKEAWIDFWDKHIEPMLKEVNVD